MIAPDYISPFTAYRTWDWQPSSLGIRSLNGVQWTPLEAHVAKCNNNKPHAVPDLGCSCGIYAAKHWKHLIEIGYGGFGIHGEVALWGTIEECSLGYRAQYAYPKFFCIPPNLIFPTSKDSDEKLTMRDTEKRMEALIAYNVDIFVTAGSTPKPDVQKVPLWVKDFGYSAQGIDFIRKYVQRIYSFKDDRAVDDPAVGERLCIKDVGIAIVNAVSSKDVIITLFNQTVHRIPRERIRWHSRNNRWESDTTGYSASTPQYVALG